MTRTATIGSREAPATLIVAEAPWTGFARAVAVRRELRLVAPSDPDADIVASAMRLRPHVALLDGGSKTLGKVLQVLRAQDTRTLVVCERCDPAFIFAILRQGASGWIHPFAAAETFVKAVLAVRSGHVWLERRVLAEALGQVAGAPGAGVLPAEDSGESLTRREHEIARWVAKGLTNKAIARELGVSHETVKKHLKKVFSKLGVHHRSEVILRHHA